MAGLAHRKLSPTHRMTMGVKSFCGLIVLLGMMNGCANHSRKGPDAPAESKNSSKSTTTAQSSNSTVVILTAKQQEGRRLYERNCEDCHNTLENSTKRKATKDAILNAILKIPEMADLDDLKVSEINAIVEVLK